VAGRVDDSAAGSGENEEERAESLGEEAPTLERGVVEVLDPELLAGAVAGGGGVDRPVRTPGRRWVCRGLGQVSQRSLPGTGVSSST
jgi:hypothetical protein